MLDLFPIVVLLPLLGFLHNGLLKDKIPHRFAGAIGTLAVFIPFLITLGAFNEFNPMERTAPHLVSVFDWIVIGNFKSSFGYQIDQLSLYMTLIITGIGSLIHLYSMGYMKGNKGYNRFFAYLNLFIFCMLNLVLSDNLVLTFLGWEGVGLASYLLIGFDYDKVSAAEAGMKAFILNRIGDVGFILGTGFLFWLGGSLEYLTLQTNLSGHSNLSEYANIIALFFFIAAMGKSAQIPLYVWLPDAMAGPTPVSALIHAATMVTAGVFLIVRLNFVFYLAPETSFFIACIGALTALFAATIGILQNDIKKILAYSTVSQLGFMFLAMGSMSYVAGLFHLMTHAFFKALLFLGAGSVIHALHHEQNIKHMGKLFGKIKITSITFLLGTLAIAGFFPFSGFFSKDLILEKAYTYGAYGSILWTMGVVAAFFTSFYMFRLVFVVFFGKDNTDSHHKIHESPWTMTLPLMILAIGAVFAGFLQTPHFFLQIDTLERYFAPVLTSGYQLAIGKGTLAKHIELSHNIEFSLAMFSVIIASIGFLLAYFLYQRNQNPILEEHTGFRKILFHKYYIDEIYEVLFVKPFVFVSKAIAYYFDTKILDRFFIGIGGSFGVIANGLRRLQSGFIGDYALYVVLGTFCILAYLLTRGV
ncbi:NADH dehydrogenase (ubiquinone), L chain [Leptospira biflexa serovar Patoc strain 'Patoc 1 (Ames)']|uniref:NADH-ubiquinone oxidoreductase chain 5 n=1 Tax=Leptospira biflexa serovar Patoc (strain Patoc 1 / ATCC 23582 / Paris) TaxID=456481 RepID=B0SP91_LEPBP|nr:NADH-quinone oxidoreductase subunit L [Leptospira biflexa]ABZ93773.1 NADH dehydrogenase (ubiquinone), L chain [Leptospira biflexa serovar Patoc strain 'Patoc 1 (Ames)']ABZ97415.1 NADH-quinone oxidoreductase, chain L [Leptospira biflexa serovar Patoc strain 'Patoc 1 (Paris)']